MNIQTQAPRFLPREHGTYAELGFPLVAALLLSGANLAALTLALAFVLIFLAHEPLLVLLGQRGNRALRLWHARARQALGWRTTLSVALLGFGLWLSPMHTYGWIALGAVGAGVLGALIYRKQERSSYGEILATTLLCFACVPVGLAASANPPLIASIFFVWCAGYILNTIAVRLIIKHKTKTVPIKQRLVVPALAVGVIASAELLALHSWMLRPTALVATPLILGAASCAWISPHPRNLRRVGWSVVAASTLTLALMGILF